MFFAAPGQAGRDYDTETKMIFENIEENQNYNILLLRHCTSKVGRCTFVSLADLFVALSSISFLVELSLPHFGEEWIHLCRLLSWTHNLPHKRLPLTGPSRKH